MSTRTRVLIFAGKMCVATEKTAVQEIMRVSRGKVKVSEDHLTKTEKLMLRAVFLPLGYKAVFLKEPKNTRKSRSLFYECKNGRIPAA